MGILWSFVQVIAFLFNFFCFGCHGYWSQRKRLNRWQGFTGASSFFCLLFVVCNSSFVILGLCGCWSPHWCIVWESQAKIYLTRGVICRGYFQGAHCDTDRCAEKGTWSQKGTSTMPSMIRMKRLKFLGLWKSQWCYETWLEWCVFFVPTFFVLIFMHEGITISRDTIHIEGL